jgi:hypothetical protein
MLKLIQMPEKTTHEREFLRKPRYEDAAEGSVLCRLPANCPIKSCLQISLSWIPSSQNLKLRSASIPRDYESWRLG